MIRRIVFIAVLVCIAARRVPQIKKPRPKMIRLAASCRGRLVLLCSGSPSSRRQMKKRGLGRRNMNA